MKNRELTNKEKLNRMALGFFLVIFICLGTMMAILTTLSSLIFSPDIFGDIKSIIIASYGVFSVIGLMLAYPISLLFLEKDEYVSTKELILFLFKK